MLHCIRSQGTVHSYISCCLAEHVNNTSADDLDRMFPWLDGYEALAIVIATICLIYYLLCDTDTYIRVRGTHDCPLRCEVTH